MRDNGPMLQTDASSPYVQDIIYAHGEHFIDYWIVPFGIPTYLLTDNGPQFVSKFYALAYGHLGVSTRRRRHIIRKLADKPNDSIANSSHASVITSLNANAIRTLYVQLLNYAYNTQVQQSTNTSPYSLLLSRHPPGPSLMRATSKTMSNTTASNPQ